MAKTKYIISLTDDERQQLQEIIEDDNKPERAVMRAKILLMSDSGIGEKMSVVKLADALGTTHTTVQTVRAEYAKDGLEAAVFWKIRTDNRRVTPEIEKQIAGLMTETPPEGHKRWTVRLLCQTAVDRGIIDHISVSIMHALVQKYTNK